MNNNELFRCTPGDNYNFSFVEFKFFLHCQDSRTRSAFHRNMKNYRSQFKRNKKNISAQRTNALTKVNRLSHFLKIIKKN